ncbi:MAG TPA: helix-turn-helix domain-containing protein [Acidimicrobiales bacterium]|nr:helix-turn-helix domain-containing protein [Acidimicrobiales bacterium]
MPVNRDKGHKRTQAERSASTRAALLAAGRELFTERGFAGAAREEIVERAGVTRGALYHHFTNKEDLFRAVLFEVEAEIGNRVAAAALQGTDPLDALRRGCQAFLDSAMDDAAVRRIVLLDAPAVLGWQAWRDIEAEHGIKLMKEGLEACVTAGVVPAAPLEPLAHMLLAALNEAALLVANAKNRRKARAEVGATVDGLLARLASA